MPRTKRPKPLYQRGPFALYRRAGRANLEIVWYDENARRERSTSAGTADCGEGRIALDRRYLASVGQPTCPTCGREYALDGAPLLTAAIADYLILSEAKAGSKASKGRLSHVIDYLVATGPGVTVAQIDEAWVNRFRVWLHKRPVTSTAGKRLRDRSLGHVEGCVRQLAAAVTASGHRAKFKAEQPRDVSKSPSYRADVPKIAAMFRFAMASPHRRNLLAYLRIAVATWARPDAIFDVKPGQWFTAARVLDLNPAGRRQTKKHRPKIPIARQFAPWLDDMAGPYMAVSTIRSTWEKMRGEIGLPGEGEAGLKLIRRSMSTLARKRIGEANWRQGEMMLGHVKASVSDIYAIPDPANLGLALAATEAIIDEIELLAPGSFYRTFTASVATLKVVKSSKNG